GPRRTVCRKPEMTFLSQIVRSPLPACGEADRLKCFSDYVYGHHEFVWLASGECLGFEGELGTITRRHPRCEFVQGDVQGSVGCCVPTHTCIAIAPDCQDSLYLSPLGILHPAF